MRPLDASNAVALCALAAAVAWPGHVAPALASDESRAWADFDIYHGGALVERGRISPMMVTGEPITIELRYTGHWERDEGGDWAFHEFPAPGGHGAPAISMDAAGWAGPGGGHAAPAPAPTLMDHGNGTASLTVDRSAPAGGELRLSAGEVGTTLRIRVMPPPPPPGYGSPDGPAHPPPRIAAQARLPLCADAAHGAGSLDPEFHKSRGTHIIDSYAAHEHSVPDPPPRRDNALAGMPYGEHMSGVPPVEGMVRQDGYYELPFGGPGPTWGDPGSGYRWWDHPAWGCYTWASYGTQAPQLLRLCSIQGNDRIHHYARHQYGSTQNSATSMISPHTGYVTWLSNYPAHTYAAAPGPYWEYEGLAGVAVPYRPDADVPPVALYPIRADETAGEILTRVVGTYSSVPELLPFDDLVVIRATGFHADDVAFEVSAGGGLGLPRGGAIARVNGTSVPMEVVEAESTLRVPVRVSEAAWESGILIRGITDGRATEGSIVRDLHEVTLVAEIPVDAGGGAGYGRLDPSQSVEPWGCWPREGGAPMRVGSRDAWPAEPSEGARLLPAGQASEHVGMGGAAGRRMEAEASTEPMLVDVRAPEGWGEGTVISARVSSSSAWPPSASTAVPGLDVANRGDGTAIVGIEGLEPGEHAIEFTATGPAGDVTEEHTLRITPPRGEGEGPNLEPELVVLLGGRQAGPTIDLAASPEPATLELRADDPEGDPVRFAVAAAESSYGTRAASMVRLDDRGDGTAMLLIDRSEPGELVLDVFAYDAHGEDMATHLVRVLPPAELGVFRDGLRVSPPLVELAVSDAPALLEARAGVGGEVSARTLRSSHWGLAAPPEPPRAEARAGGVAEIWVDASAPGEHIIEVTVGDEGVMYVIRVLPVASGASS